jgi:calcineurin-like phosphoesterase family protein
MKTWITSDLHHNHKNIIKFCPWSRGKFESIEHMNHTLISNLNTCVQPDDLLYILGDVSFGSPDSACDFIGRINCKKILVHGNHDRKLIASSVYQSSKDDIGIIEDVPYKTISYKSDKQKADIVLFHFPIEEWDGSHRGSYHFHGHQHNPPSQKINSRRMDIGVDSNNLMPYLLDDVIEKLTKQPFGIHHAK